MNIHAALEKLGVRISYGDKWLVFNEHESEGAAIQFYSVYQRKTGQKKNRVVSYATSLETALLLLTKEVD